jgi:hypothetical protein
MEGLRSRIYFSLLAVLTVFILAPVCAYGLTISGDNVVVGAGSSKLVFPDATTQSTATLKGDKGDTGLQGPKGDTGLKGDTSLQGQKGDPGPKGDTGEQGLPGVANGITKGVHGLVGANGATAAAGVSVIHSGTGVYALTFNPAFGGAPTCVITPLGHQSDGNGFIACEPSNVSTTTGVTFSCFQYLPAWTSYSPTYSYSYLEIDTPFMFICVN